MLLVKNLVRGLKGLMVHCLIKTSSFYVCIGAERQVKLISVNVVLCLYVHFHSTYIKKWLPHFKVKQADTITYHISLMKKILIWYQIFLFSIINSVILNVCRYFKRKVLFLLKGKRLLWDYD